MEVVVDFNNKKHLDWLVDTIDEYKNKGGEYKVVIKKNRDTRSQKQNRYYWGVVLYTIANELGYDSEELHEIFKAMFLKKTKLINGKEVEFVDSTAIKDVEEFKMYLDKVIRYANVELGISISESYE